MTHKTIDEILSKLDRIIESYILDNNYLGIFAYVYRRKTDQIKTEVELGKFEDNERMQKFDILFANLYLKAYRNYMENKPVSKSWELSFQAKNEKLTIIQHLLLGMNAHINLYLAVAASTVMEGKPIQELQSDFNKVNDILADLLNDMQAKIGKVSMMMFLLDWIGRRSDEKLINFSITQARNQSWRTANELWALDGQQKLERTSQVDLRVSILSEFIKNPKRKLLKFVLKFISRFEENNAATIIAKLKV